MLEVEAVRGCLFQMNGSLRLHIVSTGQHFSYLLVENHVYVWSWQQN